MAVPCVGQGIDPARVLSNHLTKCEVQGDVVGGNNRGNGGEGGNDRCNGGEGGKGEGGEKRHVDPPTCPQASTSPSTPTSHSPPP